MLLPLESRANSVRWAEGSTANTSAMFFFDPPSDSRPSIPLADDFLLDVRGEPVLVLVLLQPAEDCLLIMAGLANVDIFTKRGLEPIRLSQASSVNNDHRVNSCNKGCQGG